MEERIFLSPPHMCGDEVVLTQEAFASNWIAPLGPFVDRFERELGTYLDGRYVCATSSGTGALHLGLMVLGVTKGDRVYCSDFTFSASANIIRYCGAEPVFIDSDEKTWQMDPACLEAALARDKRENRLPKAVIVVDLYGISANYDAILPLCEAYGVAVLEDSAEALGSTYRSKKCGCFGRVSGFSFNGNKIITTSGGGAMISDDPELVKRARFLATQAREPRPYYHHYEIGYNYRLSNILAALGCGQMSVLEERVKARREICSRYHAMLGDIDGLSFMPEPEGAVSNCWLTVIQLDPEKIRLTPDALRLCLEEANIESRLVWKPMHLQPVFESCEFFGGDVCRKIFERGLCLPSGSALTQTQQIRICDLIHKAILR
ncbi:MAG: aminotransferase class I/II-fold pyridoxal phosphate-dependent enzyme [Proteobacteria bacterium]|nr:aminotransferase class I/II-fold pyridoxal phosphate-dependent enzyme [Pseudomonadota bacterium]